MPVIPPDTMRVRCDRCSKIEHMDVTEHKGDFGFTTWYISQQTLVEEEWVGQILNTECKTYCPKCADFIDEVT